MPASGTTVPLLGPPELPLVEVRLNGTGPYRFLVDLGSNVVIVRRSVADESGLEIVLDREPSDIVRAATLEIGDASFEDVWLGAYDELDVDGVIGYNLLMGTGVVMDYAARFLRLGPIDLPDPDGVETLPYEVHSRLPYVPARIGERRILLNFDTGAANHIVFPAAFADSLSLEGPPEPGPALYNHQTGVTRVRVARLEVDIRFGGHLIERPVVLFDEEVEDAWLGSAEPGEPIASIDGVTAERLTAHELRTLAARRDTVEVVVGPAGRRRSLRLEVASLPAGQSR